MGSSRPGDEQTHLGDFTEIRGQPPPGTPSSSGCTTSGASDMVNGTNTSALGYSYEYYLDYLDPIPVDERKLRAHKHAIAIAFWVGLMAFVLLLLLTLLYVSWSGSPLARNHAQHQPTCPWGLRLDLPLRVLRHLLLHRPPRGTPQAPPSSTKEPQQLMQEGPAPSTPTATQAHPGLLWEWALSGDPMASADVGHKPSWPPPGDGTDASKPRPLPSGP